MSLRLHTSKLIFSTSLTALLISTHNKNEGSFVWRRQCHSCPIILRLIKARYTCKTILSLFLVEADRLRNDTPPEGIQCINDLGDDVYGKPDVVVDNRGCSQGFGPCHLCSTKFHSWNLPKKALKPYLKVDVPIGAMEVVIICEKKVFEAPLSLRAMKSSEGLF